MQTVRLLLSLQELVIHAAESIASWSTHGGTVGPTKLVERGGYRIGIEVKEHRQPCDKCFVEYRKRLPGGAFTTIMSVGNITRRIEHGDELYKLVVEKLKEVEELVDVKVQLRQVLKAAADELRVEFVCAGGPHTDPLRALSCSAMASPMAPAPRATA